MLFHPSTEHISKASSCVSIFCTFNYNNLWVIYEENECYILVNTNTYLHALFLRPDSFPHHIMPCYNADLAIRWSVNDPDFSAT